MGCKSGVEDTAAMWLCSGVPTSGELSAEPPCWLFGWSIVVLPLLKLRPPSGTAQNKPRPGADSSHLPRPQVISNHPSSKTTCQGHESQAMRKEVPLPRAGREDEMVCKPAQCSALPQKSLTVHELTWPRMGFKVTGTAKQCM